MLTLKLTLKAICARLPKLFYFCLQWFSVCLLVVYTIKSDFYEMSPLAKVKRGKMRQILEKQLLRPMMLL